jgi:ABC-type ATPase involved in cell division
MDEAQINIINITRRSVLNFRALIGAVFQNFKKLAAQKVNDFWAGVPDSAALHRDKLLLRHLAIKKGPFFPRRSL